VSSLLFHNESSDARDHCANERSESSPRLTWYGPIRLTSAEMIIIFIAFLSYLRLSMYMAIVAVAIVLSFHIKSQPSAVELRMARPLGIIFWGLSIACLGLGLANYISSFDRSSAVSAVPDKSVMLIRRLVVTVNKYSKKVAMVQTGWKTQMVSLCTFMWLLVV